MEHFSAAEKQQVMGGAAGAQKHDQSNIPATDAIMQALHTKATFKHKLGL